MKRKQIRKYKWHLRRFKSSMIKFNAQHEGRFLNDAIENIFAISTDIEESLLHQQDFSYVKMSGWAEPEALKLLTTKKLQRLNIGQFIVITKDIQRNDVKEALGDKYHRTGFEIIFQSKRGLAPKLFPANSGIYATASNSDVQLTLHDLEFNDLAHIAGFQSRFLVSIDECSRRYHTLFPINKPRDLYLLALLTRFLEESSKELIQAFRYSDLSSGATFFARLATGDLKSKLNYLAGLASVDDNSDEWERRKIVRVYEKSNGALEFTKVQPNIPTFEDLGRGLRKAVAGGLKTKNSPFLLKDLTNINVIGGGTIYDSDNLYVTDAAADPRHEYVSGQWTQIFGAPRIGSTAIIKKVDLESSTFNEGILLAGRNDDNYYHWMIDTLPTALALDASCDEGLPFIISSRVPQSGKQALRMVSKRRVIEIDASKQSAFKRLIISTSAASILDTTIADWSETIRIDGSALMKFREVLLSPAEHPKFGDKIFLKRTSNRRGLMNQTEIIEVAEQMGYSVYDPSELDFADQLNLFRFAKIIVGATGAVMANFIFTSKDAKIVGLTSSDNSTSALPAVLANIAGCSYFSLEGKDVTRASTHTDNLHNNFVINVKQLRNALRVLNLTQV
jgi:capsular polysaccharide biosynthesis protein